jgi:adenylylsulfate kinase-like enzyme
MMTSANVTWHEGVVGRAQRWSSLGVRGATIWFTGLPASGKSTIAAATEARLVGEGRAAYRLDGDNLRHGVCGDLGFSPTDRDENVRRTAEVARLFADSGTIAIVSVVSPFEECMRRDPKGLYARAAAGQLTGMTGVDAPYEVPSAPDVELVGPCDVSDAVERVLTALEPARAV